MRRCVYCKIAWPIDAPLPTGIKREDLSAAYTHPWCTNCNALRIDFAKRFHAALLSSGDWHDRERPTAQCATRHADALLARLAEPTVPPQWGVEPGSDE